MSCIPLIPPSLCLLVDAWAILSLHQLLIFVHIRVHEELHRILTESAYSASGKDSLLLVSLTYQVVLVVSALFKLFSTYGLTLLLSC